MRNSHLIKPFPAYLGLLLALIVILTSTLYLRPAHAEGSLPHEYSGSIQINGMSIDKYLDRLSKAAEILEVDLDKSTFDLHLKVEGFQARSRLGQSVRVDASSTYQELFVDPFIEGIDITIGSRVNFYLRFLRSSDHEMVATETDIYTGRFKQSGIGREPLMDLNFTDPDSDGDGLTNVEETILGLDFRIQDTDGDGLYDGEEVFLGNDGFVTNPKDRDSDDDGLSDYQEVNVSDPWEIDTDLDGVSDFHEVSDTNGWITDPQNPDTDGDRLTDGDEINGTGPQGQTSNPQEPDSDGDGLSDSEEVFLGEDGYITQVRNRDSDGDGLTDGDELSGSGSEEKLTSNPLKKDTDDDGIDDYEEVFYNQDGYVTDPRDPDSDGDLLTDRQEIAGSGKQNFRSDPQKLDSDDDGISDHEEVFSGDDGYITDPLEKDTDKDTLSDKDEIDGNNNHQFVSNPTNQDTDGDGIPDNLELNHPDGLISDPSKADTDGDLLDDNLEVNKYRTDPNNPDSDGDLLSDGEEVNRYGTDPVNPDTDGNGVNDKDQLTREDQGFNYLILGLTILSVLAAGTLGFLAIRPRLYVTSEQFDASLPRVRDEAFKRTLEDIKNSSESTTTMAKINQNVKASVNHFFESDRFFTFTKRWNNSDVRTIAESISTELGAEKDGDTLSFNFIAAFLPISNDLSSTISTLADDWWGFVPMKVMELYAAPEFIYQDQHWSAHRLAPLLLRSVLAPKYTNLTRIPATGLDLENPQHGYQFHTILAEYS